MWRRYTRDTATERIEWKKDEEVAKSGEKEREREQASTNQTDLSESTGLTTCLPASRYATGWGSLRTVSNLR